MVSPNASFMVGNSLFEASQPDTKFSIAPQAVSFLFTFQPIVMALLSAYEHASGTP